MKTDNIKSGRGSFVRRRAHRIAIVTSIIILFAGSTASTAQVRPVYDRGTTGLIQLLKRLNTSASVLMIGAHPDDEDTALLAYLARGENARTAYLSLTRGDGGQNIIGSELGESLGLIRTEELLQARRLDGAEQFFTRAYDYGFSKTLAEAKSKWDESLVLCDAVRVIRLFRPLVVVAQFTGTPPDGHGQHQFAGYIAPLAVRAAADTSQCTDAGPVWKVQKFYQRARGGEPRLRINTGKFDPILGRSYFEIAMEARSQHKSQEQGVLELHGDQFSGLNLQGSDGKEGGMFDGLDVSVRAAGTGSTDAGGNLSEVQDAAEKALREFDPRSPERILPQLVRGYRAARNEGTFSSHGLPSAAFARGILPRFVDAIVAVLGLQVDALSDVETIVPGESFNVSVKAYSPLKEVVRVKGIELAVPAKQPVSAGSSNSQGWTVIRRGAPTANSPAFVTREAGIGSDHFTVIVPRDAELTEPYWLVEPRKGDLLTLSGSADVHGLPLQPSTPRAWVTIEVGGVDISVERPVEFRFADDIRGEIRRNVDVVPAVSVELDKSLAIVPFSTKGRSIQIAMTVTNNLPRPVSGKAYLNLTGAGFSEYKGAGQTFNIQRPGEKLTVSFEVVISGGQSVGGAHFVVGYVEIPEGAFRFTSRSIAYPHIQTHRIYDAAMTQVAIIDLKTAPVKIGYLAGSGDRVADAIRQMGFPLEVISEKDLANGDISKYDTIVVGIRAYQVRPDIVANNKRLLDFANAGGTLIVQYQLPAYAQQNLAPFPHQMGPRVADENAEVKFVIPEHPIFNFPNKITNADFSGWVQERNLYNFSTMDPKYTGLLESHDAGEPENKGGLVIADVGKGKFIYCSYSMFRQMPAGVPGAYRLLANMLSLPKAKK